MNVAIPKYGNAAIFYPDATGDVGSMTKTIEAQTLVTFDYGALLSSGVTINNVEAFYLDVQTNPQLVVGKANISGPNKNLFSFIVCAGVGGITYTLTVEVLFSDQNIHSHLLHINVIDPTIDSCCSPGTFPAGYQQAEINSTGIYINTTPRYYVSPTPPTGAKVFDRWYNSTTGVISDYVTDGSTPWWQSLYSLEVNLTSEVLFYLAVAGQFQFFTALTPDLFGNTFAVVNTHSLRVAVNGVRQMPLAPDGVTGDYTVDAPNSVVTFEYPLSANDVVVFDVVEIF